MLEIDLKRNRPTFIIICYIVGKRNNNIFLFYFSFEITKERTMLNWLKKAGQAAETGKTGEEDMNLV